MIRRSTTELCADVQIGQQVANRLYSSAPRESRRARERAQDSTSYGDYVQRSAGMFSTQMTQQSAVLRIGH